MGNRRVGRNVPTQGARGIRSEEIKEEIFLSLNHTDQFFVVLPTILVKG
jgi:hypothetical protein